MSKETEDVLHPDNPDNPLNLPEMKDVKVAPAHGIAAMAFSLALKYHDITTVQDGTLYQQYKLEGKNLTPLHLDHVFETATRIERHLLASSERIAAIVVEAIATPDGGEPDEEEDLGGEAVTASRELFALAITETGEDAEKIMRHFLLDHPTLLTGQYEIKENVIFFENAQDRDAVMTWNNL